MRYPNIIVSLLISWSLHSQDLKVTDRYFFYYKGDSIKFDLPKGYETSHFHYTEGDYFHFYKSDSTTFVIHCGAMVRLPHLRGEEYVTVDSTLNDRRGVMKSNGKLWREINLLGSNIYYKKVTEHDQELLDAVIVGIIEKMRE